MNDDQYHILEIIKRHLTGDSNPAEEAELEEWLRQTPGHEVFFNSVYEGAGNERRREVFARIDEEEALRRFDRKIDYREKFPFRRWIMYAAAIVFLATSTIFFLWHEEPKHEVAEHVALLPGKKQATLVLASGEKVELQVRDSLTEIVRYAGVKIVNEEGKLMYKDSVGKEVAEQFNELITPRGGEYHVALADGTMVWLNADSRLKYPVAFDREKREVHLTGEAYFEVTKDANRPFYVVTDGMRVKVYGTEFNVNTHRQGVVQTTLVNGKVGVTVNATGRETMLAPNQMLEYDAGTGKVDVRDVDVYSFIAWKSGEFMFDNERLEDIMEQLRLWYDVEVFYGNEELKNVRFTGNVTRFVEIENVLNILERTGGVGFTVKGRSVTVYSRKE